MTIADFPLELDLKVGRTILEEAAAHHSEEWDPETVRMLIERVETALGQVEQSWQQMDKRIARSGISPERAIDLGESFARIIAHYEDCARTLPIRSGRAEMSIEVLRIASASLLRSKKPLVNPFSPERVAETIRRGDEERLAGGGIDTEEAIRQLRARQGG